MLIIKQKLASQCLFDFMVWHEGDARRNIFSLTKYQRLVLKTNNKREHVLYQFLYTDKRKCNRGFFYSRDSCGEGGIKESS